MDIFISYAREDAASANRIYHSLQGIPRVTPWLDSKKLLPGVRWKIAIMDALKTCDLFILLLSSKSVSKNGFVQKEISEALDKLKAFPPDQIFLVPARLDDCQPKHPELLDLQWVDLFPDWDAGLEQILKVIENHLGEPVKLPSEAENMVIETVSSQTSFEQRLKERGELRGVDAMEINFSSFDFSQYDLRGANFVRCRFKECDFNKTLLRGANFEGAVFTDCGFAKADLSAVNFWGADIQGIKDFDKALLEQTNFYRTRFTPNQRLIIAGSNTLELGDYGTFVNYFTKEGGMSKKEFAQTFAWINHRYFRIMFGENTGNALPASDLALLSRLLRVKRSDD